MGYYTFYNLDIYKDNRNKKSKPDKDIVNDPYGEEQWEDGDDPIAVLRGFSEEASYAIDENGDGQDSTKWYEHDEDMVRLSKMFPDIVFKLTGEGETPDGLWECYYKNGKIQHCPARIIYDDFDEEKLEEWVDPYAKYRNNLKPKNEKLNNLSKFTDFQK
jgi:Fe-S oxidoreductase